MLTPKQLKKDLSKGLDLYFYISNRGGRKSSAVQELLITEAIKKGNPFVILRNKVTHKISHNTFSKYIRDLYTNQGYKFKTVNSDKLRNMYEIYAEKDGEETLLCYGLIVSCAESYKSNYFEGWENVSAVLWEECIDNARVMQDLNPENIKAISKQLENVLSIMSTVTREHRAPLIALGNDIEHNIINSVTANLDILERLHAGQILDTCIINQKEYKYLFTYFQVNNDPMLWLDYKAVDICREEPSENLLYYLKTNHNNYKVFGYPDHIHIAQTEHNEKINDITTYEEFLRSIGIHHYIDTFALCGIFGKNNPYIKEYIKNYKFIPPEPAKRITIDYTELKNKSYSEVTPEELQFLTRIYKNIVTYSNVAVKYYCKELIAQFYKLIIGG